MGSSQIEMIGERKRDDRERLVREMEEQLGLKEEYPEDQEILDTKPQDLVRYMKEGRYSAGRVMSAYIRAACAAQRQTNCLTEIMFKEALAEARVKDKDRAATGTTEGDFWGLPSSFKDTFNVLGVDTSLGCSPHCGQPTADPYREGGIVKLFRQAGGIPFCKTNIPQTLLAFECCNPVFGRSTNPHSSARTPGGSSGGEAALVTLNATPLGWGSDGGSLRIPAHYSGCCGLKPVRGRWPTVGSREGVPGFDGIVAMIGPMARNVEDLTFAAKTMMKLAEGIPSGTDGEVLLPIPWRDATLPQNLRVGYMIETAGVKTSPACARAVRETVAALEAAGHSVVPFEMPDPLEALRIFAGLTSSDGYQTLLANIGKDPMEPSMQLVTLGSRLPSILHRFASWLVRTVLKDEGFASVFECSKPKPVKEYWSWLHRRDLFVKAFNQSAWEQNNFDMIVCPVQAVPALEHGRTKFLSPLALATMLFNIADMTVGVLPVAKVDVTRDAAPEGFLDDSNGSWILEKRVYGGSDPAYDAEKMHGLPVGVQIVGKPWEEEKVLAMMAEVERLVGHR